MAPSEITAPVHTKDIGLAIAAFCEDKPFDLFDWSDPEAPAREDDAEIATVDASDANNLVFVLTNGQRFTIRVIAGARP